MSTYFWVWQKQRWQAAATGRVMNPDVGSCCGHTNHHKAVVKLDVDVANAVVAGGSSARVLDLTGAEIKDIPAEAVELPIGQAVFSAAWSPDGQLLTVSTTVRHLCTLPGIAD